MMEIKGMAWNHSRGFTSVVATAQRFEELNPDVRITWEKRSLQAFADASLSELSAAYDLLVMDHPHVALAAEDGLLLPYDDYLTKDISQAQMMARIVALFRRVSALKAPSLQADIIQHGPLTLNSKRMHISWQQHTVDLTVTEFWIVHSLLQNPGHVKNRQQLMDAANMVWDDNTITSHIKRVRKKFSAIDKDFDAIETAYGMGYRWKTQA